MNAIEIRDYLFLNLECYGAIRWHNNKSSYYIKFKDNRVGSIRISDHAGRKRYSYRWIIVSRGVDKSNLNFIISEVIEKCQSLTLFDPTVYVGWKNGQYQELEDFEEYKKTVHGK